ncbi:hypothetical protein ELZ20_17025 [Brucella abortus]|nr:hypothetical protein ELZ20_17025 [Brucella abortus]
MATAAVGAVVIFTPIPRAASFDGMKKALGFVRAENRVGGQILRGSDFGAASAFGIFLAPVASHHADIAAHCAGRHR